MNWKEFMHFMVEWTAADDTLERRATASEHITGRTKVITAFRLLHTQVRKHHVGLQKCKNLTEFSEEASAIAQS